MVRPMRRLALLTAATMLALSTASAAEATRIEIRNLAKDSTKLVGQRIATHGCLVNTPHGEFIEPCGSSDWRELTLILDSDYKGLAAFQKLGIDFASNVEGDFSGVLVEKAVDWPEPGKRVFLQLDSVANTSPYEP